MQITPDLIASVIIALFGGGAVVKILEVLSQRPKNKIQVSTDERENLRQDVLLLRKEINDLRTEVDSLRNELNERQEEIAEWTTKFFTLKLAVEKIMIYLKSKNSIEKDAELGKLVRDTSDIIEKYERQELNKTPE